MTNLKLQNFGFNIFDISQILCSKRAFPVLIRIVWLENGTIYVDDA